MRIGSLFSGIGGLELGLEWAGLGHTIWQVERDPFCRAVLAKHWPDASRFDDVRHVSSRDLVPVDLICGGFPCQDVSSAGKRAGLGGTNSGLWFEFLRVVTELRPGWVVVENVSSGAYKWVDQIVEGLELEGYACLPVPLAAVDVGAPHERARVFVIAAHADAQSQPVGAVHAAVAIAPGAVADVDRAALRDEPRGLDRERRGSDPTVAPYVGWRSAQPDMVRVVSRVPRKLDRARITALGNAVVPQCAEAIGYLIQALVDAGDRRVGDSIQGL